MVARGTRKGCHRRSFESLNSLREQTRVESVNAKSIIARAGRLVGINSKPPILAQAAPLPPAAWSNNVDPLPPFGTNPPRMPETRANTELGLRQIRSDPREAWYLALPQKMQPKHVAMILRAALGGDLWQQWQLQTLMLDAWPMFRKCSHELRDAVARTKFKVRPHCIEGQEPTQDALDRAELVSRALDSFAPNPFTDEAGFRDMVYDMTDAVLSGLTMVEVIWNEPQRRGSTWERLPRASSWVHPRHFTFDNNGQIVIYDDFYKRLQYPVPGSGKMLWGDKPDPDKFLTAQYRSRSGSALGSGLMRPLGWYFSAVMYNRDWMFSSAQRYSTPFIEATYSNAMAQNQAELDQLENFISGGLSNGYIMHREGTTITVHSPPAPGAENHQKTLMTSADEACMFLLLGQSSTTKGTAGTLGNEQGRTDVKRERVEAVAQWVCDGPLHQFCRAILRVNYGNEDHCPTIEADFTEVPDPMKEAQTSSIFMNSGVPMVAKDFYAKHNLTQPKSGDLVLVRGQLGKLGSTETVIDPSGNPPMYDQFGQQIASLGSPKKFEDFEFARRPDSGDEEQKRIFERFEGFEFAPNQRGILSKASDEELGELETLSVRARDGNGDGHTARKQIAAMMALLESR